MERSERCRGSNDGTRRSRPVAIWIRKLLLGVVKPDIGIECLPDGKYSINVAIEIPSVPNERYEIVNIRVMKPENGVKRSHGNPTHMTIVATYPVVNIAIFMMFSICFALSSWIDYILVNILYREVIRWRWRRRCLWRERKSGRGKGIIIGEVVFGEQTIDGFAKCVRIVPFVPLVCSKAGIGLSIILDAINPLLAGGRALVGQRRVSTGRLAEIVLEDGAMS